MNAALPKRAVFACALAAAFSAVAGCVAPSWDGSTVPLLSDGQKAYLDLPREERIAKFMHAVESH